MTRKLSAHFEHTVAITRDGHPILAHEHGTTVEVPVMPVQASTFALRGIAPFSRQARTSGPKRLCPRIQASSRGEERAKQAAARIRNTVVGSNGRNAPTIPKAVNPKPRSRKTMRAMLFETLSQKLRER